MSSSFPAPVIDEAMDLSKSSLSPAKSVNLTNSSPDSSLENSNGVPVTKDEDDRASIQSSSDLQDEGGPLDLAMFPQLSSETNRASPLNLSRDPASPSSSAVAPAPLTSQPFTTTKSKLSTSTEPTRHVKRCKTDFRLPSQWILGAQSSDIGTATNATVMLVVKTIEELRRRKARPDAGHIHHLLHRLLPNWNVVKSERALMEAINRNKVCEVEYKGCISYRIADKPRRGYTPAADTPGGSADLRRAVVAQREQWAAAADLKRQVITTTTNNGAQSPVSSPSTSTSTLGWKGMEASGLSLQNQASGGTKSAHDYNKRYLPSQLPFRGGSAIPQNMSSYPPIPPMLPPSTSSANHEKSNSTPKDPKSSQMQPPKKMEEDNPSSSVVSMEEKPSKSARKSVLTTQLISEEQNSEAPSAAVTNAQENASSSTSTPYPQKNSPQLTKVLCMAISQLERGVERVEGVTPRAIDVWLGLHAREFSCSLPTLLQYLISDVLAGPLISLGKYRFAINHSFFGGPNAGTADPSATAQSLSPAGLADFWQNANKEAGEVADDASTSPTATIPNAISLSANIARFCERKRKASNNAIAKDTPGKLNCLEGGGNNGSNHLSGNMSSGQQQSGDSSSNGHGASNANGSSGGSGPPKFGTPQRGGGEHPSPPSTIHSPVSVVTTRVCETCRKKTTAPGDRLLVCTDCHLTAHGSCLGYGTALTRRAYSMGSWQCNDCKICFVCRCGANENNLLLCDACDQGYHMTCTRPPITVKPVGSWLCRMCLTANVTSPPKPAATTSTDQSTVAVKTAVVPGPSSPFQQNHNTGLLKLLSDPALVSLPGLPTQIKREELFDGVQVKNHDVLAWTPNEICDFFTSKGFSPAVANVFVAQEIDGNALMLLKRDDVLGPTLNLKLGPALKLYKIIDSLQQFSNQYYFVNNKDNFKDESS